MSDTRRWTQPGYEPEDCPAHIRPKSKKHQQKDRNQPGKRKCAIGGGEQRFTKGVRNSFVNLRRKVDDLKLKEETE